MLVAIKDIKPNPFRHLERYPIIEEKVELLRQSIRTTGFWDNIIARRVNGSVEIAYGHHRLEALKREFGPDHEVDLIVRDISDADMLRIMANENMEEWSHNAAIEIETVRAVVEAFANGQIELRSVPPKGRAHARIAPGFGVGDRKRAADQIVKRYTPNTISKFLGWNETKIKGCLQALALIEQDIATDDQFDGLSGRQATKLVRSLNETLKAGEATAKNSLNPKKARRRAKIVAQQTARELAADIKDGDLADSAITDRAREIRYESGGRPIPDIDSFASRMVNKLTWLLRDDALGKEVAELVEFASKLDEERASELVMALRGLATRSTKLADAVETKAGTLPFKDVDVETCDRAVAISGSPQAE